MFKWFSSCLYPSAWRLRLCGSSSEKVHKRLEFELFWRFSRNFACRKKVIQCLQLQLLRGKSTGPRFFFFQNSSWEVQKCATISTYVMWRIQIFRMDHFVPMLNLCSHKHRFSTKRMPEAAKYRACPTLKKQLGSDIPYALNFLLIFLIWKLP